MTRRLAAARPLAVLLSLVTPALPETLTNCPAELAKATVLVVVNVPQFRQGAATATLHLRGTVATPFGRGEASVPVAIGRSGLGWSSAYSAWGRSGEPAKREGDGKTPAGIFPIGRPFGFGARDLAGFIDITGTDTVCVDDPASSLYGELVARSAIGEGTHLEDMRSIDLYRSGIAIDYPSDAQSRSGSCIFLHVWRRKGASTAGCVALPEPTLLRWQRLFDGRRAAIAILPAHAANRLRGCLAPG